MTDRKFYRTTLTVWTATDPTSLAEAALGNEVQFGSGFVGGRTTDVLTSEEVARRPEVGEDLLDYFNIDRLPLCQFGSCVDDAPSAEVAVALVPHVNGAGVVDRWDLACQTHMDWADGFQGKPAIVRYDLVPVDAEQPTGGIAEQLTEDEIEVALRTLAEIRNGDGALSERQEEVADRVEGLWVKEQQLAG